MLLERPYVMNADTDHIIGKVLKGDIDAFKEIIDCFQGDIWGMTACYIKDRSLTEDIVQRTFIKAYSGIESYERGRSFIAWLKAIALNEVRMELRKTMSESKRLRQYIEFKEAEFAYSDIKSDNRREKLPEHLKSIINSKYTLKNSIQDIADQTKKTVSAVKKALSRTRFALKTCIENMEEKDA